MNTCSFKTYVNWILTLRIANEGNYYFLSTVEVLLLEVLCEISYTFKNHQNADKGTN